MRVRYRLPTDVARFVARLRALRTVEHARALLATRAALCAHTTDPLARARAVAERRRPRRRQVMRGRGAARQWAS